MKTLIKSLGFVCISLLLSCINEELPVKEGSVKFNFKEAGSGKVTSASEPSAVVVSITKSDGTVVEEMTKLDLLSFGSDYISYAVQLPVGHYKLIEFFIVNEDDKVLYACPIEGSELSPFVNDPLPINFEVTEDGLTIVKPQVLAVTEESDPEDFGYVKFGFEIIVPQENSVQLKLDGTHWKATYVEHSGYNDETHHFYITGRKTITESIQESLWIMINNMELAVGEVPSDNIEIQMIFNEGPYTGTMYDTDFTIPKDVKVKVTAYDSENDLISGVFSSKITNPHDGTQKVITLGVFYKVKVTHY